MSTYLRTATSGNSKKYASQEERLTVEKLPEEAKVVICGGGAQGAAIAYKLAEAGWAEDVVLLEQGALGGRHHMARHRPHGHPQAQHPGDQDGGAE